MRLWEPQVGPLGEAFACSGSMRAAMADRRPISLPARSTILRRMSWRSGMRSASSARMSLGLSLGGMTGFGLALDHADRVDRLVAADCRADAPAFFIDMWDKRQQTLARERHGGGRGRDAADLVFRGDPRRTGPTSSRRLAR